MTHSNLDTPNLAAMDTDHGGPYHADPDLLGAGPGDAASGTPPFLMRQLDESGWRAYLAAYQWGRTRPSRIVLHHTVVPTLTGWAGEASMRAMQRFYAGKGWPAAPHLYTAPDGIWMASPMDAPGIHAGTGNCNVSHQQPVWGRGSLEWYSIGLEMVGQYDAAPPAGVVWELSRLVLGTLCQALGINPESISFHRDYTNQKSCPGKAVTHEWVRGQVRDWLAAASVPAPAPSTHRARLWAPVFEAPPTAARQPQVAWAGRAVLAPGQELAATPTTIAGWVHWAPNGFVEAVALEALPSAPQSPPYTADSPILGAPAVDADALAHAVWARCDHARSPYAREAGDPIRRVIVPTYIRVCAAYGVDVFVALAQCLHETGDLAAALSQRTDKDGNPLRNPAGIGVNGDTSPGPTKGFVWDADRRQYRRCVGFTSWETAIQAQIGRLLAYALLPEARTPEQQGLVDQALAYRDLDVDCHGSAPTLRALGSGPNPVLGCGWAGAGDAGGVGYGKNVAELAEGLRRASGAA